MVLYSMLAVTNMVFKPGWRLGKTVLYNRLRGAEGITALLVCAYVWCINIYSYKVSLLCFHVYNNYHFEANFLKDKLFYFCFGNC